MRKMKFIGLIGSNAAKSYNRMLMQYMQRQFSAQVEIELAEIKAIPLFDEDQIEHAPQCVLDLAKKIEAADGIIIATPEYDHAIPAALKSTLEWLSSVAHPFKGKPVMIVGASYGNQGTAKAQENLRMILNSPGLEAYVLPGNEFLMGYAQDKFDQNGKLHAPKCEQFLIECFNNFISYVQCISHKTQQVSV